MKVSLYSLLLPALLGGAALVPAAANAQPAGDAATVSLDVTNVPVPTALRTLFKAADIRNFTIDADVQGMVNASLKDVPFPLALKQVLSLANQPLAADVQDGIYHVHLKPRLPDAPAASKGAGVSADTPGDAAQSQVYKTGINHYDARVMADLITRRSGIILVPSGLVMPGNLGAANANMGAGGTFGPGVTPNGIVPANGPVPQSPVGSNLLPDGIKRIFALQSDNSLVIETGSADGTASSGNPFFPLGYNSQPPGYNFPSPGYNSPPFGGRPISPPGYNFSPGANPFSSRGYGPSF